jgi:hypothetical protein
MKKINIYSIFLLLFLILANSCNESVLEQDPVDSFNEESIFQDLQLAEAFLWQCYDYMGDGHENVLGMREDLLSSATDELLNIHRAGEIEFLKGTLTPDELGHFGNERYGWINWSNQYSSIKNVNTLIEGIDKVPTSSKADEELKAQIKAEALFIRAFNYVNLLRSYGGVILIDRSFQLDDNFENYVRSSLQETVEFILTDLDAAISDLPIKTNIEQGRATKGAAAALKSRLLSFISGELTNGGYEASNPLVSFTTGDRKDRLKDAQEAAKKIIDGEYGFYNLTGYTEDPPANISDEMVMDYAENYYNIFLQTGAWNDEVIWGVQYLNRQGNTARNNLYWGPNGYNNWGNNEPLESTVRQFEMKDGSSFEWNKYSPEEENIREFSDEELQSDPEKNPYVGREARFYASILFDGAPWQERESTNNKIQASYSIDAPGANLIGLPLEDKIEEINKLEPVTTGGMDTRSAANQAWNGTKTGYYLKKMVDIDLNGELNNNENAWIEFRFAEVLLDYAEASIELGEIEKGIEVLNKIRNRAGLPDRPLSVTQEQAREWYRHETYMTIF